MEHIRRGVIVVPAATPRDLEGDVLQDNDFRQDDYFFYLTGLETPDAWLILAANGRSNTATLLLPERNPGAERWTGLRLGPGEAAVRLSGVTDVRAFHPDSLEFAVQHAVRGGGGPLFLPLYPGTTGNTRISDWTMGGQDIRNIVPALDSMRVVKDSAEIAALRRAIWITAEAHRAALRATRPEMYEYQLEAVIEYTFRNLGADRLGFPSIVGSGPNSTTLHYDVNRRSMQAGDLVVIDIGAEYGQYTADVTRTIPVSGSFTPRQKALYDLVLDTQRAAIDAVRPGITVRELTDVARRYMREHSADLCPGGDCTRYFVHGLSHWLGLRVHDVGDYRMPLEPGMVLTIEPGIYIAEEELGIRIEDDILVTATGAEVLSAHAPRTTSEIEAMMRAGREQTSTRR